MKCPICHNQNGEFKVYEVDCQFIRVPGVDQHLVRHQCPNCDVIFGSQQMLDLTREQLKDAYQALFNSGVRDGNEHSEDVEVYNVLAMDPNPGQVYLNWGAGSSKAPAKLAKLGHTLINYDPFVTDSMSEGYLPESELSTRKFDGIISHNLMEHLREPVEELKKMKSLLKPGSYMIHTTECYKYMHAHTKFHLFFFEGRSLEVISQQAGLTHKFIGPWAVKFTPI